MNKTKQNDSVCLCESVDVLYSWHVSVFVRVYVRKRKKRDDYRAQIANNQLLT